MESQRKSLRKFCENSAYFHRSHLFRFNFLHIFGGHATINAGWFVDLELGYLVACLPFGLRRPLSVDLEKVKRQVTMPQRRFLMGTKIYIGNLSYDADNMTLDEMFKPYGTVTSAQVIMDRSSGRSKGFGFVEMSTAEEAKAAIDALNGTEINGRAVTVNEAKPREDRPRSGGGRGGFGGGRSRY
jgi:cold-inducible RNA-binding protein